MSYQLVRDVLAAHALQCSFCVVIDARRTDLADDWYAVMKCVKPVGTANQTQNLHVAGVGSGRCRLRCENS